MLPSLSRQRPTIRSPARVIETTTRAEVVALLRGELRDGDVALVKGSRGLAMEEIVADLAADGAGETEEP